MISFESALNSIPATQASFSDYDWIRPVSDLGDAVDRWRQNNFYEEGKMTITDAINTLVNVHNEIDKTQIFYHNYPEKQELMATILQEMDAFAQLKTSMDPYTITSAAAKYNDNLEKARSEHYRKYLREKCEEYNRNNHNIVTIWYEPVGATVGYNGTGGYRSATVGRWSNGQFIHIESPKYQRLISEVPDQIKYDFGIYCWDTFLDMKNDRMVEELKLRGVQIETLERPGDTYNTGGSSGSSSSIKTQSTPSVPSTVPSTVDTYNHNNNNISHTSGSF